MTSPHPLTRFLGRAFTLTRPPAPQGIPLPTPQPISLETDATSLGLLTSSYLLDS
jgi:hypothetical protein